MTPDERQQLQEKLNALQGLVRHPGWSHLEAALEVTRAAAHAAAKKSKDGHELARAFTVFDTIGDLLSWPEREARLVTQLLNEGEGKLPDHL